MMSAAGCAETGCRDAHDIIRLRKLKAWAESDAKFLRKLSLTKCYDQEKTGRVSSSVSERSESFERFACRQRFLTSYPFDQGKGRDTVVEETMKWLKKMKRQKKKAVNNSCSPMKACVKFFLSCTARVNRL